MRHAQHSIYMTELIAHVAFLFLLKKQKKIMDLLYTEA